MTFNITAQGIDLRISGFIRRWPKVPLKVANLCGLLAVAAGIAALSLEIQKFRRKFKSSAGSFFLQLKI
jgi:hypothetical protein